MKLSSSFIIICLISLLQVQQLSSTNSSGLVRAKFKPAKLIDFASYKKLFGKQYESLVENVGRKRIFFARAFSAFISAVDYKLRNRTSYLAINHLSDRTDEELSKLLQSYKPSCGLGQKSSSNLTQAKRKSADEPKATKRKKTVDELVVDHRLSGCFAEVRLQGDCGSCYLFAMIALYEYQHCIQTGKLVEFSEQYPLNCGFQFGMFGCDGGTTVDVAEFAHVRGFQARAENPYLARVEQCRPTTTDLSVARIEQHQLKAVELSRFKFLLMESPFVVDMRINSDFFHYGGGVDSVSQCTDLDDAHSVVLVGYGREDGKEFWLIRNSYGPDWGQQGYYKLDTSSDCILCGAQSNAVFKSTTAL